jgi:pantothenate kinase-related protein Tda10
MSEKEKPIVYGMIGPMGSGKNVGVESKNEMLKNKKTSTF